MTTPITGGTSIYTATPGGVTPGSKKLSDQDTFLKLLVAQLKYQDPSNPADSTQFLAQTAQFTQVEKLGAIAETQQNMLNAQMMLGASSLVGRTVTYVGPDGADVTGVVTSAKLGGSDPTLRVGDTDVQLSKVKEVRQNA